MLMEIDFRVVHKAFRVDLEIIEAQQENMNFMPV